MTRKEHVSLLLCSVLFMAFLSNGSSFYLPPKKRIFRHTPKIEEPSQVLIYTLNYLNKLSNIQIYLITHV